MIESVAVVGAGTMGGGIAQLCAQRGFPVRLYDAFPEALDKSMVRIRKSLDSAVLRGKIDARQAEKALDSIRPVNDISELARTDLIIEAVNEDLELKRRLFSELARIAPDAVLSTNTSSLRVSEIAEGIAPERLLGIHFFNPPAATKLVEMARTPRLRPPVFEEARNFVRAGLGKIPVNVKDVPGFIVNRVMRPYYLESQRLALEGIAIQKIDAACRERGGVPMGPFELMDLIGLDVNLSITKTIYEALGRPERFKPVPLQEKLVESGRLGRKTGDGFYRYKDGRSIGENPKTKDFLPPSRESKPDVIWDRMLGALIAEAELAEAEGVAGKADIDTAVKLAMNFPKGPFEWRAKV